MEYTWAIRRISRCTGFVQLIRSAEARLDIIGKDRRFARMHNRSGGEVVTSALLAGAAV